MGERADRREAMEQQAARLRESGVRPDTASRIARETALRLDRKIENGTTTIPKKG